jgi:hypothetical protein
MNAQSMGLTIKEYRRQRARVKIDKTRGRGGRKASELDDWGGPVDGQLGLFETNEEGRWPAMMRLMWFLSACAEGCYKHYVKGTWVRCKCGS